MERGGGILTEFSHLDLFNNLPNLRLIFLNMRQSGKGLGLGEAGYKVKSWRYGFESDFMSEAAVSLSVRQGYRFSFCKVVKTS